MADSTDFSNSPLADPNFLKSTTPQGNANAQATDFSRSPLADPAFLASVPKQERPRALTASEQLRELERQKDNLPSRSVGEFIGDQVTGAASGFVGLVGGAVSLGISGVGAATQYFAEDGSLADDIGGSLRDFAVHYAQTTNEVTDFIRSGQSDTKAENQRLNAQMGAIQAEENMRQFESDVADGESEFIAGLTRIGRDALDTTARVLSDPLATEAILTESLGSLGPSAKFARAGVELASGIAQRLGVREGTGLAVAETVGSAVATGAIEGSGTYAQTVDAVMSRSFEEMLTSPMFRELIEGGMDPLQAQKEVADATGMDAFRLNFPAAIAAGVIAAKFNANPIATFEGQSLISGLREVGAETLEEMSQGGASQVAQNLAMAENVDDRIRLADDVGENLAVGAIGGATVAGALGIGPTIKGTIDQVEESNLAARQERAFIRGMGEQIAAQRRADARRNMTPEEREAELRAGFTETSPGVDLFNSVVRKAGEAAGAVRDVAQNILTPEAAETVRAGVQAVREAAAPVVDQVIKTAQNFVDRPNPVIQSETVAAADSVVQAARDPAVETGSLGVADPTIKKESLPEIFKDSVPEGASLADTMSAIVRTISEKKVPISEMKDDAILFVAQKYNDMQNAASSLSSDVQTNIKKVLASSDLERIRKRAARLDLNTAISPAIEKISSTVKNMTVAMSKLNPTNVNPDVADRILKQEDSNLTPEEARSVEIAASVTRPLNAYKESIVRIADEKYQALVATGQNPPKPETNVEQVSRNLIVGNLSGDNKVPSINDFANRIIVGMQSPDQSVDIDGVRVPVKEVASNMRKLVQHMVNKVNALNESFDKNDERGVGPAVNHDTLVRGKDFIKAGMAGSKSVTYNKRSLNSVTFAKTVGADATVLGEVYNALVAAYPEVFPEGPVQIPVLKTEQTTEVAEQTQIADQSQTASETVSPQDEVNIENTTAVEEVFASAKTDEQTETTQDVTPDQTPETQAVEDATPVASETDAVDDKIIAFMNKRQIIGNKVRHIKARKPTEQELKKVQRRLEAMSSFVGMDVSTLLSRIYVFDIEKGGYEFGGFAFESNVRDFGIEGSVVAFNANIFDIDQSGALDHIVAHEMGHVIDYAYSAALGLNGDTASFIPEFWAEGTNNYPNDGIPREDPVEVKEDGAIFAEVKASIKRANWFKNFFSYALGYDESIDVSSELFAELVAMHTVYGDRMAKDFPKFLAHYNKVLTAIGGKIEINEETTPTEGGSNTESPEGSVSEVNPISDGNGKPLVFYHGTKNQFTNFAGNEIFLTTQRGLAKEHALRKGAEGTPRLIAANVTVRNPLVIDLPENSDLDIYWLENALKIKEAMAKGDHDAILITNAEGDALVIATDDSQITQIVDPVQDRTPGAARNQFKGERFVSVFRPKKNKQAFETAEDILTMVSAKPGNKVYEEFARTLLSRISEAMNARVATLERLEGNTKTLAQGLKEDQASVLEIRDFKPLMIVDPETGIYDQRLLDLASMAVIDWLTTARAFGSDRLDDLLKDLGLERGKLSDAEINALLNSVPVRSSSEGIAKKIIKLWNVRPSNDAQMVDIRGTTEGLVKEIFTVLSEMEEPLINIIEVKTGEGKAAALEISALAAEQEAIGFDATGSLDKVLFPEDAIMASFGEPITYVPKSQNNKPDVLLSDMERAAIKRMQTTAHIVAEPVVGFFQSLGLEAWGRMAGVKDSSKLKNRHPLKFSIEGKNVSIERDFNDAFQMVRAAEGRPVFYPVGVTNVGRHQMKGINPQNNKVLRAMITPTHSKLDMVNNQAHKNGFWLTVAQSSGLAKVEKKDHLKILATIQEDFSAKFGEATAIALAYLETGTMDSQGFADAMLKATKGEDVSVAQVNAVLAVARLQQAQRKNDPSHLENFETTLSFELDGKTDGPANMMVAFGQGLMTREEFMNFKRVGLFLGSKTETLNSFLSNNQDLYEVNSVFSTKRMMEMINAAKGLDKKRLMALQRFATHFGDFEIKPDGSIVMSRATSKNPMTKKVYGSGENGIAEGISQDMLVGFYTQLTNLTDGQSVEEAMNYPEINDDLDLLFETKLPDNLDVNQFTLPSQKMASFAEFVKETIGVVLSSSIEEVMDLKTIGVNDLLVYTTNVQGEFMKLYFEQRLAEVAAERAAEGIIKSVKGKPVLRQLPQSDYDAVVQETLAFAPLFADGNQTLRIGDFTGQVDNTEMSSNFNGNLRPKSTMARPDNIGVKGIPYVIQGRGDAMMMNRIFGAENAPERAIPIFDGIDMAITDFMGLSNQINEAVLANWDNDVIGPIADNFESFLARVEEAGLGDKLQKAFTQVKTKSEGKTSVVATDVADLTTALQEAHRLNMARKAVFKLITLSVDHMGGSGQAYVRNADGKELTYEEINQMIQDHLDGKTSPNEPEILETPSVEEEESVVVTDVATVVEALVRELKKPHLRDVIRAIRSMLPDDARIIMGTPEQITAWRKENLDQNPIKKLDQTHGYYDIDNNIIFVFSENPETIVHEMIHMATFQAVLDHYNGVKKTGAVKNLEVLMEEFLSMDTTGMPKKAQKAYASAKTAIVKAKSKATALDDAIALNEFMAWTLANDALMKELKQTPTSLVARLTKMAKAFIQRILGVVPLDMYSNILFNTEMIRDEAFGNFELEGSGGDTNGNDNNELTPPADNFTNFWIDLLRQRIADAQSISGLDQEDTIKKRQIQQKLGKYYANAQDALVKLDFGGFGLSEYQKKTFIAIHTVIATELRLDTNALVALGKMYEHVTNNLTPAMFGTGQAAQDRYSTVMELMGATTNDEGISDAVAVLLALSQTSLGFRTAIEQIPSPAAQPGIQTTSLNDVLTSTTGFLMQKLVATTDTEGKGVKEILDALSDQILRQDDQNEFNALRGLMGTFTKADTFLGGAMSRLAQRTREANRAVQADTEASGATKTVMGAVALATSFLDKDLSKETAKGAKAATHMNGMLDGAVFIRELVAEVVGADSVNTDVIQMLDKVNYVVQSARQAYREELPVILQNEFDTHPTAEQWKDLHHVLGKTDFSVLFDLSNPDASFDLMSDQALLDRKIKDKEKKILKEFPGQTGQNILLKAQQLADFMNGKGAGFQLWKNAYAIHKLAGGKKDNQVVEIDRLISLYALKGADVVQRESVARMQASDPRGVHNLIVYMQALNKEEDQKTISEAARMNGYKGYIPDHAKGEISLIIARDADREALERRGYTRVADDTTDTGSLVSRGYYMSTTKQGGNYSQGVLQQVQDTYRGVNATTGLTVNGTVSGVISGVAVISITNALNNVLTVNDNKNVLIPVFDQDGGVLFYERGINPDLAEKYLQPESNMALMLGAWAGRQVEEKFSHEYNKALITRLKEIWDTRDSGSEGLFVRMDEAKDKIYAESWTVIPPQLKEHIIATFGEETGFMVRKDMINLALGYRDPSIVDVWTGNNRLPKAVELAVKVVSKGLMGDKAFKILANTETVIMNTISTAKDVIVVRSLVVPFMNTQSNVFQLVNRGVGTKQIMKGYRDKFVEIDKLNENLRQIMALEARIRLAATDKNKVSILKQQIQVLKDENKRFSVAPLVEAGAYKSISEGITELDVSITDGKFGDWVENQLNKLPAGVQTVAKYGLLSKDTALYRGANKAVQYGDFIAKSIYYDDLTAKGLTHDEAMARVNEEFVNFSLLPGRTRTYLESMGATWFLTFKIRSMKVALQMMRENPARSLVGINALGLESGPITDNMLGKLAEGTLPYSLGWDMLWDASGMNPWVELFNG